MHNNRPFLPDELIDEQTGRNALRSIGIEKADLLGISRNAVFATDNEIVRILPPSADIAYLKEQISLARFLADQGFPTPRPLGDFLQTDKYILTRWEKLQQAGEIDWREAGKLVRNLHETSEAYVGDLPAMDYFKKMEYRLEAFWNSGMLREKERALFQQFLNKQKEIWQSAKKTLPQGVIHSDIHADNIFPTSSGIYLLDWDWVSFGERENDLFKIDRSRWSGSEEEARRFFDGYGIDPEEYPRIGVLHQLWLFSHTARLAERGGSAARPEVRKRMLYWQEGPAAPLWQ